MHPLRDPQLVEGLEMFYQVVPGGFNLDDIPGTRQFLDGLIAAMAAQAPEIPGVVSSDHQAPGADGTPDVTIRIYQPEDRSETLPALLWIHGGGYVLGNLETDDIKAKMLVTALNCVIASVDYRLAPEHPFPAPLDDCYAALKWLAASSRPIRY